MDTVSGSTAMPRLAPSSTENITDESATILMRACFLLVVVRVRTAPPPGIAHPR